MSSATASTKTPPIADPRPLRFAQALAADLHVLAGDAADDGLLERFFAAYDAAFVLANEKGVAGGG